METWNQFQYYFDQKKKKKCIQINCFLCNLAMTCTLYNIFITRSKKNSQKFKPYLLPFCTWLGRLFCNNEDAWWCAGDVFKVDVGNPALNNPFPLARLYGDVMSGGGRNVVAVDILAGIWL